MVVVGLKGLGEACSTARGVGTGEIANNPDFSGLKGDPAFQALLKGPAAGPAKTP